MADEEQHQDQSNSLDNGGGEQKNVKFSPSTEFATEDLSDDSQGPEEEVKTTTTTYAVAREGSPLSLLATIDEEQQQRQSLKKLNDCCGDRPGVTFTPSTQFCTEDCLNLQEDVEQFLTSEEEALASSEDEEQPLLLSTSPCSCKDTTPSLPPLLSTIKEKANDVKNTIVAETIKKMPFTTRTPTPPPVVTPVVTTQEMKNTTTIPVAITPGVNSATTPAAVLVLPATETTPLLDHIGSSSKISGMDSIATFGTTFTAATEIQFHTPHNVTTTTPLTSSGQPPQQSHSNARRESIMSTMSALTYNEDDIELRLSDFIEGDFDTEIPMTHDDNNNNNNNRTEQSTYNTINLYRNTTCTGAKRPERQSILANKRLSRHSRNILVSPRRTSSFTELGDMYETVPTQLTDNVKLVTNEQMYYEGSHKGQIYYAESSFFQNHQSPKYAVTISCDIYRQILQEMDDANSTACGLYFCCHGGDGAHTGVSSSDYVDIKLAWSLVLAIFAVLLVIDYTFPWPEDDHTSDDMFSAQLLH